MRVGGSIGVILLMLSAGLLFASPGVEGSLINQPAPELNNETWINSAPLRLADLRGKVVLLEFWTFG